MIWTKERIIAELKRLDKKGVDISYNKLAKKHQALVSAAAYHFRSYRNAIEKAGLDYAEVTRRPRWSKQSVVALIKSSKKKNLDLNWASVTKRRDDLGKAAFAAIQGRLFGSWEKALAAAGILASEVSRYRKWNKDTIVAEIKTYSSKGKDLNSGAIQKHNPGLHAAALRYYGSYDNALKAAKLNPGKVRKRKSRRFE